MKSSPAKKAYDTAYESTPDQVKKREMRNKARAELEKKGLVKKGEDVDHKKPLANGGTNAEGNLRPRSVKENRGWRKGKSDYNPG
jgi:hypothetical protein